MSLPSPASDYAEKKLSLDDLCGTNAPYVNLIRAQSESQVEMIMAGDVLIVNSGIKPRMAALSRLRSMESQACSLQKCTYSASGGIRYPRKAAPILQC